MKPISTRTPTSIGDLSIDLLSLADPGEGDQSRQARFEIQVLDQDGRLNHNWFRQGDLVPFLDDTSTYLTTADKIFLIDLLDRVRQEAALRILGV